MQLVFYIINGLEYSGTEAKKLLELLKDDKVRSIVLFGESGIGKTWTARDISSVARKRGLVDIILWVFLNREYDRDTLCDSMAHQLSLLPTPGESEVEDVNEKLKGQQISTAVSRKKLLLVLDDEGSKMNEERIMSLLGSLLNLDEHNHKEESVSLLKERAGTGVFEIPGIKDLAEGFIEKTKYLPDAIVLMAKAFNHFAHQDSGVEKLKCSLEETPDNETYNITHLLRSGYDLLPNSILLDCCWSDKTYERGHQFVMDLIDFRILKKVEAECVIMERPPLNLDDILMERAIKLDDCHRGGFGGATSLGLATAFSALGDDKWKGLGRVAHKNGNFLVSSFSPTRSTRNSKFSPFLTLQLNVLSASTSTMHNLSILVLRGCHFMEKIDSALTSDQLTVLEISGPSSLMSIPDEFFKHMPKLCSLNLSTLLIDSLPLSLYALRTSKFKEFHDQSLEKIVGLKILDLSGTAVDHLPSSLGNPRHLYFKDCTQLKDLSFVEALKDLETLDLSKSEVKTLPSLSHLSNLRQLLLSHCSTLEELPELKSLEKLEGLPKLEDGARSGCIDKLEVLDLSGTAVGYLPSLKNFSTLNRLLLKDCPCLQEFLQIETLHLLDATVKELPYGISELTHLERLDLPNVKNTQESGNSMMKEPNQYGWGISSLPAKKVGDNGQPPVSVSSSNFSKLWKTIHRCGRQASTNFISLFIPLRSKTKKELYLSAEMTLRSEISTSSPDNFLLFKCKVHWRSVASTIPPRALTMCLQPEGTERLWIERCREMESVFHEDEVDEVVKLGSLELPDNLEALQRKSCTKVQAMFEHSILISICCKLAIIYSLLLLQELLKLERWWTSIGSCSHGRLHIAVVPQWHDLRNLCLTWDEDILGTEDKFLVILNNSVLCIPYLTSVFFEFTSS
ncbi:hypothetical protein Acr_18g0004360 [Actinidia rufa]|uniref:NB-ARC domain-containing protein n=1 Tax=Actinidia rufa TaxID=165716 RepID=A0A7J0G657_9ERIC|nr:hypothetical protein Acr_18g0004360 [Actinidia rufa]